MPGNWEKAIKNTEPMMMENQTTVQECLYMDNYKLLNLTNTLVVSVRYFGGTKLGVGGLIQAYKTSAKLTLETASIQEKTIDVLFLLLFEYPEMSLVMRNIKDQKIKLIDQKLEHNCNTNNFCKKKRCR